MTGTIDLASVAAGAWIISPSTFADGIPSALSGFDAQQSCSWQFLTASGGVTGFSSGQFTVNASQFLSSNDGVFAVVQNETGLALSYTAVPEPAATLLGGIGTMCLLLRRRALIRR